MIWKSHGVAKIRENKIHTRDALNKTKEYNINKSKVIESSNT